MKQLDKIHKNVLDRIIYLKDKHNLTDKEFGIKAGVGEKAIDNWKRGLSASYMKKLDMIADFFNVSVDYLLYGNEQKNSPSDESKRLSEIENKIIAIYRTLPEEKKKAFMTIVESLKSPPKDK
jgi:repressor LexA